MAKCSVWTVAMFCVSSLMAPAMGWGQIEKASVVGRVSDATGASAPGATIEIVRLATNEVHRAVSTSTGDYTIVELAAGDYELRASLSGFKTFVRTGVRLARVSGASASFSSHQRNRSIVWRRSRIVLPLQPCAFPSASQRGLQGTTCSRARKSSSESCFACREWPARKRGPPN